MGKSFCKRFHKTFLYFFFYFDFDFFVSVCDYFFRSYFTITCFRLEYGCNLNFALFCLFEIFEICLKKFCFILFDFIQHRVRFEMTVRQHNQISYISVCGVDQQMT